MIYIFKSLTYQLLITFLQKKRMEAAMSEFERCVCFQLTSASQKIRRRYRDGIAKYQLTHGQFFMLCAILEEEGLLPSHLADKTELDRSTATGLLLFTPFYL